MLHSKLKKILSSVTVMALMVMMVPTVKVHAVNTNFDLITGTFTISGNGPMNVTISDFFKEYIRYVEIEYGVTSIGFGAFEDCKNLCSITIPSSVKEISAWAFKGCKNLHSITIPDSVTSIGASAFEGCKDLYSITIPGRVTEIGYRAFKDCSSLESIIIPDSVTSIGDSAFEGCSRLTSVAIPSSLTDIGIGAFRDCSSEQIIRYSMNEKVIDGVLFSKDGTQLLKYPRGKKGTKYIIPKGVKEIGDKAFNGCKNLCSITIPSSVKEIGASAFEGCSDLRGSLAIPEGVTSIGDYAFQNCGLYSIEIPDSVTSIGNYAFSDCSRLEAINIDSENKNYKSIDGILFSKDGIQLIKYPAGKKDTSYTIPDSVTSIVWHAFYGCSRLEAIIVGGSNTNYKSTDGVLFSKDGTQLIQYPRSKKCTNYIIPKGVTSFDDSAFFGCSGLKSVTIPDSVTSIGDRAFGYCSGLKSITIPSSVIEIGYGAFAYCSGLKSITIPSSVTEIGEVAFSDCSGLTTVTIPASVTKVEPGAFQKCSGLKSVTIPASVTEIGNCAFSCCSGLQSVTYLGNTEPKHSVYRFYIFGDCDNLKSVKVPYDYTGEYFCGIKVMRDDNRCLVM